MWNLHGNDLHGAYDTYDELSLWNPATREFKAVAPLHWPIDIPKISIGHTLVGFGFDSVTNDFKIVRQSGFSFTCHIGVDIYSLNTNSWKRIRSSPLDMQPYMKFNMQAFFNGVGYWPATWTNDEHYRRRSDSNLLIIMSFNFTSEVFGTFDVPEGIIISFGNDEFDYDYTIIPYLERFAFVVKCTDLGNAVTNFDIWVVDQFCDDNSGTPVSWQRLSTIGPFPSSDEVCLDVFRMDGDVLGVIGMEEEATLYDPTKGCFKNLGVKSSSVNNIFVESLYPLSKRIEGALRQ